MQGEYKAILRWSNEQATLRTRRLKESEEYIGGLGPDTQYADIDAQAIEKIKALYEKYGLNEGRGE